MMARQGVSGAQCRNFAENYKIFFTLFLIGASSFNYLTKLHKYYLFFRWLVYFLAMRKLFSYSRIVFLTLNNISP